MAEPCICDPVPDPWCTVHPFTITTTPARRNQPRPPDDPAPHCPPNHRRAGGRCWTAGCDNSAGEEPIEDLRRYARE